MRNRGPAPLVGSGVLLDGLEKRRSNSKRNIDLLPWLTADGLEKRAPTETADFAVFLRQTADAFLLGVVESRPRILNAILP